LVKRHSLSVDISWKYNYDDLEIGMNLILVPDNIFIPSWIKKN